MGLSKFFIYQLIYKNFALKLPSTQRQFLLAFTESSFFRDHPSCWTKVRSINFSLSTSNYGFIKIFLFTNWCTRILLQNNIKIYIKTTLKYFGLITIIRERTIWALLKLLLLKQSVGIIS